MKRINFEIQDLNDSEIQEHLLGGVSSGVFDTFATRRNLIAKRNWLNDKLQRKLKVAGSDPCSPRRLLRPSDRRLKLKKLIELKSRHILICGLKILLPMNK